MKSNCGTLLIDDFGRQRVSPTEILNCWIVPLERNVDFLTLPSGRQIRVPFNQTLVLATNLEPTELVDEAFLRRIPYKVELVDPTAIALPRHLWKDRSGFKNRDRGRMCRLPDSNALHFGQSTVPVLPCPRSAVAGRQSLRSARFAAPGHGDASHARCSSAELLCRRETSLRVDHPCRHRISSMVRTATKSLLGRPSR